MRPGRSLAAPDAFARSVASGEACIPAAQIFVQRERRGTAHAVLAARAEIAKGYDELLVVFTDTPLVRPQTLGRLRKAIAQGAAVAALGFRAADPTGYGRMIIEDGSLLAIREDKDAAREEREIAFCNAGMYLLSIHSW